MDNTMNKAKTLQRLTNQLGYKAPEQLRQIMGEIGEISRKGDVSIEPRWWPEEGYLVGRLRGGGSGVHRMAILWSDRSLDTFG
jgi:hypothetical protein